MSFFNGLQKLSQICVVTCLMQRAATAHAQVETFVMRDRLLSISANERTPTLLQHVEEVLAVFKMLVSRTLTI